MEPYRAEKVIHLMAIVGIWLSFAVVWISAEQYSQSWSPADVPDPTLIWLAIAGNGATFLVPAICTIVIIGLVRSRGQHSNWVAGTVLCLGLSYAIAAQAALVLPKIVSCGPSVFRQAHNVTANIRWNGQASAPRELKRMF